MLSLLLLLLLLFSLLLLLSLLFFLVVHDAGLGALMFGASASAATAALLAALPRAAGEVCILQPEAGCIDGATATFAAPGPGLRVRGRLFWWPGNGCEDVQDSNSSSSSAGRLGLESALPDEQQVAVFVVRRGQCSFARKARNAGRRGAAAVIIMDFVDSQESDAKVTSSVVAGDGDSGAWLVPTVLIGRAASEHLAAASPSQAEIEVELRWGQPRAQARLDLWLPLASSARGAAAAAELLRAMAPTARSLGDALLVRLHFRVVSAESSATLGDLARHCLSALPQLCAPSVVSGLGPASSGSGAAALQEAVRQHCILRLRLDDSEGQSAASWWSYVEALSVACAGAAQPGLACSRRAMDAAGLGAARDSIERCAESQGLSFLEDDREALAWGGPDQIAVRINDWRYSGPPEARPVLRALCRGLSAPPSACAPFLPPVEEPANFGLPSWMLVGLCLLAVAGGRSLRGGIVWIVFRLWRG
ncbi:unnamed protein product, partial [Polarella glacialis]